MLPSFPSLFPSLNQQSSDQNQLGSSQSGSSAFGQPQPGTSGIFAPQSAAHSNGLAVIATEGKDNSELSWQQKRQQQEREYFERMPPKLYKTLSQLDRKFSSFKAQCRSFPHAISLEILEYQCKDIFMGGTNLNLSEIVGRFSNSSERHFVLCRRSLSVNLNTLTGILASQTLSDKKSWLVFVLKSVRNISFVFGYSFSFFRPTESYHNQLAQVFSACLQKKLLGKVKSIAISLEELSLLDCIPQNLQGKITSMTFPLVIPKQEIQNYVARIETLINVKQLILLGQYRDDLVKAASVSLLARLRSIESTFPFEPTTIQHLVIHCKKIQNLASSVTNNDYAKVEGNGLEYRRAKLSAVHPIADVGSLSFTNLPRWCTDLRLVSLELTTLSGIKQLPFLVSLTLDCCDLTEEDWNELATGCTRLTSLELLYGRELRSAERPYFSAVNRLISSGQLRSIALQERYHTGWWLSYLAQLGIAPGCSPTHCRLQHFSVFAKDEQTTIDVLQYVLECCGDSLNTVEYRMQEDGTINISLLANYLVREGVLLSCKED